MSDLQPVRSIDDYAPLVALSHTHPVFVFKHSLTCPISSSAFHRFQAFVDDHPSSDDAPITYALIEIQRARDVSNHVAEQTGVRHESPQALLLRDGAVVWHASHGAIRADALAGALAG